MFYAIINYQFKTSELKNVQKMVKQIDQALLEGAFMYNLAIYIPRRWSLKI